MHHDRERPRERPSSRTSSNVRWRVDHEKGVLVSNFERRGWSRSEDEGEWNFYWASPHSIKQIFNPENNMRLADQQLVNHFPNHYELTRKDLMVKNLKRYRKELERVHAERAAELGITAPELDFECMPTTFILPTDFSLFAEEFRKNEHQKQMWIMKPTSKSKGIGIFIITRLSQIRKWDNSRLQQGQTPKENYVISRYIADPLLIGGKKFDLRIYVLVLGYRPLKVYTYRKGFARFCAINYTNAHDEIDNELVHLTNVAIQKNSEEYARSAMGHGYKWSIKHLRSYIEGTRGTEAAEKLMEDIGWLIVHSLKACQNVMIHDRHCFECYGYDIMIDQQLKPWLLEVNASPSLSTTTTSDKLLKMQLIGELLDLVVPHQLEAGFGGFSEGTRRSYGGYAASGATRPARPSAAAGSEASGGGDIGNFELLYDENVELEAEKARREAEARRKAAKGGLFTGGGRYSAAGSQGKAFV